MPQLPRAGDDKHYNLCYAVPQRPRVCQLAEVPEICLPLSLVLLFPADVLQFLVQVTKLRRELCNVRAVLLAVGFRASDDDVEVETDVRAGRP